MLYFYGIVLLSRYLPYTRVVLYIPEILAPLETP